MNLEGNPTPIQFTSDELLLNLQEKQIAELKRDLAESRKATESVQAHALAREGQARGRMAAMESDVLKLAQQRQEMHTALRRQYGEQVQLAKALRALVTAVEEDGAILQIGKRTHALYDRLKEAEEVLALVEVPFA